VAGLFGVTFAGPVLVPHAPCRLCGRRCRPPRRRVSPRLRCRPRADRWSAGLSLLRPVTPAVVSCFVVVSVVVCHGLAAHAEEPPPFWWGRLLCGSSMLVECPTRVGPGGCAAGRSPGRHCR
jgi:hypothetical protein